MMKRLYDVLFPSGPQQNVDHAARLPLATCVVLLEAARADEHFSDEERKHILEVLQTRFRLESNEAEELLHDATTVADNTTDLWQFTHTINQSYSQAEKIEIMEEVWRLVLSDGSLEGMEDHLAHKLRNLLNLNHPQMIEAKMKILKEVRGEEN